MDLKNNFAPTPKEAEVADAPVESGPSARVLPAVDVVTLFEMAYNLATRLNDAVFRSANFLIEASETALYQTIRIDVNSYNITETESSYIGATTVFAAKRMHTASNPNDKKIKVSILRNGKWVEYLMNTVYPDITAKSQASLDDENTDYAASENYFVNLVSVLGK